MIELPLIHPKNVSMPGLQIMETVTGRDEKKRGTGTFTTGEVEVRYKVIGVEGGWFHYSKRGQVPIDTIAPWDLTGNRASLSRLEALFNELDSKGILSAFDTSEIRKLSHLSKFPQFPFVSDKGFGVGLKNVFPQQLVDAFKKEFVARAKSLKPSMKKISLVRRSNTGWPFLLNGTSRANEMNNLLNVLLLRTELSPLELQTFLTRFTAIDPCSVMFTRTSHGAHKAVRNFTRMGKGHYVSNGGSEGKYPRIRGVYANYGMANLAGRSLMSKCKDVLTSLKGLKHTFTHITDGIIKSAQQSGFSAKAEDIAGFDLSVSMAMLHQLYDIYEAAFPEESDYITFARHNFSQPVASPGFSKGVINLYEREGIISSGDIMTSMNGCLINLMRMAYCLVAIGEYPSYQDVVSKIFSNSLPFLIWGDDTVSFFRKGFRSDDWAGANLEIGFRTDLEDEIMFLMKRYGRGDYPPHTPLSRLVMQTIGREHPYVGPYSAMIGLYHRSDTARNAPGFETVFNFLVKTYFPNLRIASFRDLQAEISSPRFKLAMEAEMETGQGQAWLKEFIRGITRGSFDMNDFLGDSELLRYLGLAGGATVTEDFQFRPRGSLKSKDVLRLYERFASALDDYTADVHLRLQKEATNLLYGK